MSVWSIFVENSAGGWDTDTDIPRSQQDLESKEISTQQKIRLADGSNGFVTPEIHYVKEPFSMFWADTTSAFRTQLNTYRNNGDKVKIVTHTGEEFIGRIIDMSRIWFTGMTDTYDIGVTFERTE